MVTWGIFRTSNLAEKAGGEGKMTQDPSHDRQTSPDAGRIASKRAACEARTLLFLGAPWIAAAGSLSR